MESNELSADVPASLVRAATEAKNQAHCPYSGYRVGAAIRTVSGRIIAGCNVENAAYPLGTCAEQGAIAAMVLAGDHEIAELVVVTDGEDPGTPCGGCRQRIREFAGQTVLVHSVADSRTITMTMTDLLPESFGPEHLSENPQRS